jgi:hypothetical protein
LTSTCAFANCSSRSLIATSDVVELDSTSANALAKTGSTQPRFDLCLFTPKDLLMLLLGGKIIRRVPLRLVPVNARGLRHPLVGP